MTSTNSNYVKIKMIPDPISTKTWSLDWTFLVAIKKTNGSLYEPDTLSLFQWSIDWHLTKEVYKPFCIIRDVTFAPLREKLKTVQTDSNSYNRLSQM